MDDEYFKRLFKSLKKIAVVGLSDDPDKPSYQVASYLAAQGFQVIPVNPKYESVLGNKCYDNLKSASAAIVPEKLDIAVLFRKSDQVQCHVEEAVFLKIPVIWMQEGIENQEAAKYAQNQGIKVVMNKCMMKEHKRLQNA